MTLRRSVGFLAQRAVPRAADALAVLGILLLLLWGSHRAVGWRAQSAGFSPPPRALPAQAALPAPPAREGEAIGRLQIARLGLDLVVFEGTSTATLRKGPGHVAGSVRPAAGSRGNCVITGHRDSFFRRLAGARAGDVVRLCGPNGVETYRLQERRVVRPRDVSVLAPTSEPRLTLVTCYPFGWVGPAPHRLVWTAVPLEASPPTESALQRASR